ncbi:hypothetical protein [Nonomuraea sp. NPDC001831]|uniref:hypothetical protein n=1 Tax=Nonomuraea sp. NPDC001831 TaxID=3364340 RepID=UPI0036866D93
MPVRHARTPRSLSIVKAAAGLVVIAIALFGTADGASGVLRFIMLSLLALAGSWLLGGTTRRAVLEAEHATRAESQAAVAAERLRVVRELHDVVSHSLGTPRSHRPHHRSTADRRMAEAAAPLRDGPHARGDPLTPEPVSAWAAYAGSDHSLLGKRSSQPLFRPRPALFVNTPPGSCR